MPVDCDVALLGTGVAPLVAASHFLAEGKSVLLLNPDWDFFLENSELPLDPLWPVGKKTLASQRLFRSLPERVLSELRPEFPGAVETWPGSSGYHDYGAPHVRLRGRLWMNFDQELLEEVYVEASDAGLNPQLLEGLPASRRFPGFSGPGAEDCRGLLVPKLCDVDVYRYRNGLLEFVRERLGPERLLCNALQIEIMPGGVRFHAEGAPKTARIRERMLVYWTPRLSQWILSQAKKRNITPTQPTGARLWEQWSLISKESLGEGTDCGAVGMLDDTAVWAEVEGAPSAPLTRLSVLRAGKLVRLDAMSLPEGGMSLASSESFKALSSLCSGFLKWDRFSIRSLRSRALFEWDRETPWSLSKGEPEVRVIPACDGWLTDVVRVARASCQEGVS